MVLVGAGCGQDTQPPLPGASNGPAPSGANPGNNQAGRGPGGGPGAVGPEGSGYPGGPGGPGGGRGPSALHRAMEKIGEGPNALQKVLEAAFKADAPAWESIQAQTKEYVQLATESGKAEPPHGDKESWTKLGNEFTALATDLDSAAQAKDKDAGLAALSGLSTSCKGCHDVHKMEGHPRGFGRGGPGGPGGYSAGYPGAPGGPGGPGGRRGPSPLHGLMEKIGEGPNSLQKSLEAAAKVDAPEWEKIQPQAKEYLRLATESGTYDPPRGEKESWTKLSTEFTALAAELDKSAEAKDKDATVAALSGLSTSCKECHDQHKRQGPPGGFRPGGGFGRPPGGGPGGPPPDGPPVGAQPQL